MQRIPETLHRACSGRYGPHLTDRSFPSAHARLSLHRNRSRLGQRLLASVNVGCGTATADVERSELALKAIRLAARWVVEGRRVEMHGLAVELGVSRVTLFRNLGTREDILGEALWHLTEATLHLALLRWEAARPAGSLLSPGAGEQINALVSQSEALHRLLADEPALTIRVLTDPCGRVQRGVVDFVETLLRRDIAEHGLDPIAEPRDLAFALVRLGESFLYADVLANRPPDIDAANRIQRALVEGTGGEPRITRTATTPTRRKTGR